MANLLDLLSEEDRKKALKRYKRRVARDSRYDNKISSEIYIVAEFGYYYGWQAVEAIRNNEITLEEVNVLLEGARKVWYSKLVETARSTHIATGSILTKNPTQVFRKGMQPFIDLTLTSND